jgi:hypothetical protein
VTDGVSVGLVLVDAVADDDELTLEVSLGLGVSEAERVGELVTLGVGLRDGVSLPVKEGEGVRVEDLRATGRGLEKAL